MIRHPMKPIKLLAVGLTVGLLFLGSHWKTAGAGQLQEQPPGRLEIVGVGVPMSERVGKDDGAVLIVHFSGEIHGGLEPCG